MNIVPPTEENIFRAAEAIRRGRLVGMPTETVYGVAADAMNADAVRATFAAKGRPADNPLIVHIANAQDLARVALLLSPEAGRLVNAFWPGPLTLVLPKAPTVPAVTTGGLDTVAVRFPAHPVARQLIAAAGTPISAPSANLFMALSPTRADHISAELAAHLELILDGGPCEFGLESTVVDVSTDEVRLLRPGAVSLAELENVLGRKVSVGTSETRKSPGQYPRHYAPRTTVRLVKKVPDDAAGLVLGEARGSRQIGLPVDPKAYATGLYAALHDLDELELAEILVERPPESAGWSAVWDRLTRATGEA